MAGKKAGDEPKRDPLPAVGVQELEDASDAGAMDPGSAAILRDELRVVAKRRRTEGDDLVGLALSGGGIRSATFALGVLQALAGRDLLKRVDYLSTVSGGGYIGTSLLWWLTDRSGRRFGPGPDSFPYGTDDPGRFRDRAGTGAPARLLRNLKEKGNYLTPGAGINVMSLTAVVLRGVIINLFFWIPLLTLLLVPFVLGEGIGYALALAFAGGLILLFAGTSVAYSVAAGLRRARAQAYRARRRIEIYAGYILIAVIVLGMLASLPHVHGRHPGEGEVMEQLLGGLLSSLAGLAGGIVTYLRTARRAVREARRLPAITTGVIASLAAAFLIYGVLLFCHGLALTVVASWADPLAKVVLVLLLAAAFVAGVITNLNHISAHRMYRDRLMEAYMPAFREAHDGRSRAAPAAADGMRLDDVDLTNGPFPIINTNLVLVGARDRRRRLRGGDSFMLTPHYCGSNATGWVGSDSFMGGGMTLPTAMAISGAAANPNTGAGGTGLTRNKLISVLMALLNLRLGYWAPNFARNAPPGWLPNHVVPGLGAITPWSHREDGWFIELSDGGHFENLGLYELVRRRVRLIILSDGAQDQGFAFVDLQVAQRRIAADFGATLELTPIDLEPLIPVQSDHLYPERKLALAERGHVTARIRYADGSEGLLIYLKSTLVDGLPLALLGYRGANPDFPDQSTGDQFFDEEQFEAYRELGWVIASRMLDDPKVRSELSAVGCDLSRTAPVS